MPPGRPSAPSPSDTFAWDESSTYVRRPPYFDGMGRAVEGQAPIEGARVLGNFGDFITTDHISPAGAIAPDMPAAEYLEAHGVGSGRLQHLRQPSRQSRGDDARHLCQREAGE